MRKERKKTVQGKLEILVAEDSMTQATQIKHLLENHRYKVYIANDGEEAVNMLAIHKPSLVISDIIMPVLNGYELCSKIKSNKDTGGIPVILLTGLSDPEEIIEGLNCGADCFITKPFDEKYLLTHIEKLISDKSADILLKEPFGTQIVFNGKKRMIQTELQNVIRLMLNIYEGAIHQNEKLLQTQEDLRLLNERLESMVEERTSDLTAEVIRSNQIAERLRESELRFKQISENAGEWIWEVDKNGLFTYSSEIVREVLGYEPSEIINKKYFYDFFHPEVREDLKQGALAAFEQKLSFNNFINRNIHKNGKEVILSTSGIPITDAAGNLTGYRGVDTDITRQKKAEEKIKQERRLLRTLIDNIPDHIYVKDIMGRKVISNISDFKDFGFTSEDQVLGKTDLEIFPAPSGQRGHEAEMQVLTSGKSIIEQEEDFIYPDGKKHWSLSTMVPLKDDTGKIYGLVGIGHDITLRKQVEQELIKAKEKAEESDRLKTAFLHNISHEIRTPMNAIVGFCSLLGEPGTDKESRRSFIETIIQSSNHLLAIITDIVDISNIEANIVKVEKKDINIDAVLKSICNQFQPKADEKGISLACEGSLSGKDANIRADSTKVTQIISNLISNALKFTDKGSIKVNYKVKGNFLEFCVSDTGIGIPEEHHERIFDRFYQVQNSTSRLFEGTGLGLAISKSYTDLMGGRIWLSSKPGKGTSFYFTIPYERLVANPEAVIEKPVPEGFVFPEKKTVLVAEDIDSNFKLITCFLSGANTNILRASNGKEAVEIALAEKNIDIILMDIKMPEMDGHTAVKLIRAANQKIPIIAQTAYSDDRFKALQAGCNSFISKPFTKNQLLQVIKEFI